MDEGKRYGAQIRPMDAQEKGLLECLMRINQAEPLHEQAWPLVGRLIAGGLAERLQGALVLTTAGIERCQSLQHWMLSDQAAAKILEARLQESREAKLLGDSLGGRVSTQPRAEDFRATVIPVE